LCSQFFGVAIRILHTPPRPESREQFRALRFQRSRLFIAKYVVTWVFNAHDAFLDGKRYSIGWIGEIK